MASTQIRKNVIQAAREVVVKIGTNVLTGADGRLDRRLIGRLGRQIAEAQSAGRRLVVVTSGAIGAGMGEVGLAKRPKKLTDLQALAAVGQPCLIDLFNRAFVRHGARAAQLLLTREDFEDRERYLNIRNTIAGLHRLGAIPVINENDVVAVEEIRYGDNDILAAMTANLLRANLLIVLTVVDGLLDPEGKRIDLIERVTAGVTKLATRQTSTLGSGGMRTKLEAISRVTEAGEVALIANGRRANIIRKVLAGERVGTVFLPATRKLTSRDRWIGMAVRPAGSVVVDAGAVKAIGQNNRSLLPSGVVEVRGRFNRGDVVAIVDTEGTEIARGLAQYSAAETSRIKGHKSSEIESILGDGRDLYEEIIHRDHLVVTGA